MKIDLSGAQWFKSSYSQGGEACVEIAWLDVGQVGVRDSKDPNGPALVFTPEEWNAFTIGVLDGEFTGPPDRVAQRAADDNPPLAYEVRDQGRHRPPSAGGVASEAGPLSATVDEA
ncbi:DUF397 domain-containing protein [Nocardia sp. NPDC050793]|uniref:DUF397 domain-containing protein n=1 Tax=Nocardia sp. NPDC050793 TaxID=3155159 RepID=UPI003411064D